MSFFIFLRFLIIFRDLRPFLILLAQLILRFGFPFQIDYIHPDIVSVLATFQQFFIYIQSNHAILFHLLVKCFLFGVFFVFPLLRKVSLKFDFKIILFYATLLIIINSLKVNQSQISILQSYY